MASPTDPDDPERRALLPQQPGTTSPVADRHGNSTTCHDSSGDVALGNVSSTAGISLLRGAVIVSSLSLLILLQASNISLLTTIQGVIAEELDAYEHTIWFTSAYLVAMASVAPVTGRLSYVVAPRLVLFVSTCILAVGAAASGLAPNLSNFLAGRAITGTGAAGILAVTIILSMELTSVERRGLCFGALNAGFTIGVALGAVFAGVLEPAFGWRTLFWIQAPLAMLGGCGLLLSIPGNMNRGKLDSNTVNQPRLFERLAGIDYIGAFLLVGCLTSLLYGLSGPAVDWPSIAISFSLLPVFLFQESYCHPDPIIPIPLLRSRVVLLCNISTVGFMMARWAVLFYLPVYATAVRGWSPASAGSMLVPTNIGMAIGGIFSGGLHIRGHRDWWASSVVIYGLFALSLLALAIEATRESSTWVVILWVVCNGLCTGAALNYTLNHLLYQVSPDVKFIATSLLATFRGFAGTFGSAVGGGLFIRVLRRSLQAGFERHNVKDANVLIRRLVGSPRVVQSLTGIEHEIAVAAYTRAVQTLFFAGVGVALLAMLVQAGTGWDAPKTAEDGERSSSHPPVAR